MSGMPAASTSAAMHTHMHIHLLLLWPIPNGPWPNSGPQPGSWGPLVYLIWYEFVVLRENKSCNPLPTMGNDTSHITAIYFCCSCNPALNKQWPAHKTRISHRQYSEISLFLGIFLSLLTVLSYRYTFKLFSY